MIRLSTYGALIAARTTSDRPTPSRNRGGHEMPPPVGGLMLWRAEARGYSHWWAWLEENNWVYRIGLIGYAAFALSVYTLSEAPFAPDPLLFHALVWLFYFFAHVPDLFATLGDRPRQTGWHLVAPLLITAANLNAALHVPRIEPFLIERYPSASAFTLALITQAALVASAYALHFLVNALLLSLSAMATRLHRSMHRRPARSAPSLQGPCPGSPTAAAQTPPNPPVDLPKPPTHTPSVPVESPAAVPFPEEPGMVSAPVERRHPEPSQPDEIPVSSPSVAPPSTSPATPSRGFLRRLFGKPRRPIRDAPQPVQDLLHVLGSTRPKDVQSTLRFCALVAMEGSRRLNTPILLDNPERTLFLPDGTLNPITVSRLFVRLPRIHEFVPATKLGRKVYRPIARRLARALRDSWSRFLNSLALTRLPPAGRVLELIQQAPTDRPVTVLCLGSSPFHHGRAVTKLLTHLIRRNALHHLAVARAASLSALSPEPAEIKLRRRLHAHESNLLVELGVQEPDTPSDVVSDADLREATMILVVDHDTATATRARLAALQRPSPPAPGKLIELPTLAPALFRRALDPRLSKPNRATVRQSLSAIEIVLADNILPVLIARAAELDTLPPPTDETLGSPAPATHPDRVKAFRTSLGALAKPAILKRRGIPPERLLKLIWCIAHRDSAALLMHGLPDCLRATEADWSALSDTALHRCWLNLSFATGIIPRNREHSYQPILRLLQRAAKRVPQTR